MEEQQQSVSSSVFKSRLQEYAQKAGLTTPIYHTIKEGPSHQPTFRSTVVIDEKSYHSLTGFLNRKVSEQSAAEVALTEIAKTGNPEISVSHPVHETGLSKNLLQEYAQKMNYAIPSYICTKEGNKKGRETLFCCTVEIGGMKYIGTAAKTKKEAEFRAAKTALLAIKMDAAESNVNPDIGSIYTVVPTKRKTPERHLVETEEKVKTNKRKKGRFHKRRKKQFQTEGEVVEGDMNALTPGEVNNLELNVDNMSEVKDLKSNGDNTGGVNDLKSNGDNIDEGNSFKYNRDYMGEVNDLKSNMDNVGEVNKLKSNGESVICSCNNEVNDLKSSVDNMDEVNDLKANGESVLVSCNNMDEVKDLKSNMESVLVPCSNAGEVNVFKSNDKTVLFPCSNTGEVIALKSNEENVLIPCINASEVKDLKSNRESVLVSCSNPREVKDLKSNGECFGSMYLR